MRLERREQTQSTVDDRLPVSGFPSAVARGVAVCRDRSFLDGSMIEIPIVWRPLLAGISDEERNVAYCLPLGGSTGSEL